MKTKHTFRNSFYQHCSLSLCCQHAHHITLQS
jgi:hypothetical protein